MGLLSAGTLWLLGPLVAFVVALYLLKTQRTEVRVPSSMLWRRVTADMQANRPWQRLRATALLALQIAALIAIAFAAARPFAHARQRRGQMIALILDNSASMAATDARPTRLRWVIERARNLVRDLGPADQAIVIAASQRTQVLSPMTSDKAALNSALGLVRQTQLPSSMQDAVALARAACKSSRSARIIIYSDGSYPELPEDLRAGLPLETIRAGASAANTAITLLNVDRQAGRTGAFVRLSNLGHSGEAAEVTLSLRLNDRLIDAREVKLKPGQSQGLPFDLPPSVSGVLVARITPEDALPQDNIAYAVIGRTRKARVLIVGPGNMFLEQALATDDELEVTKAQTAPSPNKLGAFDIVIWDRTDAEAEAPGAEWFISSSGPGAPAKTGAVRESDEPVWRPGVDISRHAELSSMRFAEFSSLRPAEWASTLAEAGGNPLIVGGQKNGMRKISFGWDFVQSDLPLRVTFPILVSNTVAWLLNQREVTGSYTPGETVRLEARSKRITTVTTPDGRRIALPEGIEDFSETLTAGLYSWKQGERTGVFAVNLSSTEQSDLRVARPDTPAAETAAESHTSAANKELYPWFVLAALAVLCTEWLLFHRRM
ncbi:MAG: BatA and WFA domain-containing protein [Armatimonadetes bacterium]|nr:BatA and WFA domain-containing protein [Armatimonadota bacterium]